KKRLTARDDFQLEAFLAHCGEARTRLPATPEAFATLVQEIEQRRAIRRAALSRWETLGIDWRDYHPDARAILDDPFYWDCVSAPAPHGNDTGAALPEDYRKWLRRTPAGDPIAFYRRLFRSWGLDPESPDWPHAGVADEAAVALAFAEL